MTVFFSDEAEGQLEDLALYLGEHWSQQVKINFLATLSDKLELIRQMPELYRKPEQRPVYGMRH